MKKTSNKREKTCLHLEREALRVLDGLELRQLAKVAGGAPTANCTAGPFCESDRRLKRAIRPL